MKQQALLILQMAYLGNKTIWSQNLSGEQFVVVLFGIFFNFSVLNYHHYCLQSPKKVVLIWAGFNLGPMMAFVYRGEMFFLHVASSDILWNLHEAVFYLQAFASFFMIILSSGIMFYILIALGTFRLFGKLVCHV